ncbi:UDP-N-acetylmuramoyl-L-alanine--D-glutamate ligase [Leucothrix arctica]|uniref:UDP-N-acetylmuramoylalanine--D-glutamate ligase n=1 Tax=Leucothrix arctica TaxID=1481894 RepID=A0A317CJI3_9GAMM|nr:UDP-N-acetylmuramoyl-L-alanine--D-glutamate ligase [Leucothrix arctica]PWQ98734.1 UDP-N-acetylmuramoyl-L-alanine--D-glutamate ligase [Leucothrix arctica]
MKQFEQVNWHTLVLGLGKTGLSVARFLSAQGVSFAVMDSRETPPNVDELLSEFPETACYFGSLNADVMCAATRIIASPGIALATPEIEKARSLGIEVIGDIELFAREAKKPIVAVTGSNGKTTVATLLSLMAKQANVKAGTGGNIGMPALELLTQKSTELYVLELSSFQLETTHSLKCKAASILNVSEDHLDRYSGRMDLYAAAKAKIYDRCQNKIVNRDDELVVTLANDAYAITFGADAPTGDNYGLVITDGVKWLAKGEKKLLSTADMKVAGSHNETNALAALALAEAAGLPLKPCLQVLRAFAGLPHRTQWVAESNGINWFNDSKGTNVGATVAALQGLPNKTVLIAGGQGKGADFTPLANVVQDYARAVVLFGEDAEQIALALKGDIPIVFATDMTCAVKQAHQLANIGDNILLSPACASFDMFTSYENRGDVFIDTVKKELQC